MKFPMGKLFYIAAFILLSSQTLLAQTATPTPTVDPLDVMANEVLTVSPTVSPTSTESASPVSTPANAATQAVSAQSLSITATQTPTLKVTGSKTINMSYSQATGEGTGISNLGFTRHESLR